ncbi:hypothetical protein KDW41_30225 [Burkholderia vietnamiensis]|nr:hypothetical protein [Burkholderia vietnamiensis]
MAVFIVPTAAPSRAFAYGINSSETLYAIPPPICKDDASQPSLTNTGGNSNMAKIGPVDLGQQVHEYFQPLDSIKYHHSGTGLTTDVKPRLPSPGNPDGRLVDLKMIGRDPVSGQHETRRTSVRWKDCDRSLKVDLKERFRMASPPPTPPLSHAVPRNGPPPVPARPTFPAPTTDHVGLDPYDIDDARNLRFMGHPAMFVQAFEGLRIAEHGPEGALRNDQRTYLTELVWDIVCGAKTSQQHMLIAVGYLHRLPASVRSGLTPKELITGCVRLAQDYANDRASSAKAWHALTNIGKERLLEIERQTLTGLGHNATFGDVG